MPSLRDNHDALSLELLPVRPPHPPSGPTPISPAQAARNLARLADAVYTTPRSKRTAAHSGAASRARAAASRPGTTRQAA